MQHWIIAKDASGSYLGAEPLQELPAASDDTPSHVLALTAGFRRLLDAHWSNCHWVMVDRSRYVIFRSDAGVLGTIILSESPPDTGKVRQP